MLSKGEHPEHVGYCNMYTICKKQSKKWATATMETQVEDKAAA